MKIGFIMYFVFCLFSIVWLRASVVHIEYDLVKLETDRAELYSERKMVVAQRASSYSAERIEKVALNRLGMSLPERENVYFVKRSSAASAYKASNKGAVR